MELKIAQQKVEEQFRKHKLDDWKFEWMQKRKKFNSAGRCNWTKKLIRLQPTFVKLNSDKEIVNTILHEIAHALMPKHGHNKFWKRKAIEIGCSGKRCYGVDVINCTK